MPHRRPIAPSEQAQQDEQERFIRDAVESLPPVEKATVHAQYDMNRLLQVGVQAWSAFRPSPPPQVLVQPVPIQVTIAPSQAPSATPHRRSDDDARAAPLS